MDLVTVAAFNQVPEAYLAKNLLDAEGIPAFLTEAVASDMLHLTSEVKLQVAEEHAEQARAILDAAQHHQLTKDAAREAEEHANDVPPPDASDEAE
jgi:Putative prokaryotic signal transducing protein